MTESKISLGLWQNIYPTTRDAGELSALASHDTIHANIPKKHQNALLSSYYYHNALLMGLLNVLTYHLRSGISEMLARISFITPDCGDYFMQHPTHSYPSYLTCVICGSRRSNRTSSKSRDIQDYQSPVFRG